MAIKVQPRRRTAATTKVSAQAPATPATSLPIPPELVGQIFVPADTPADFPLPEVLPTVRWEVITPASASGLLELNTNNRPITSYGVARWVGELEANAWKLNGDAVVVSDTNVLFDGQHRLMACVESGIPFIALVVRGVPEDVFSSINVGVKRTAGQILRTKGVSNGTLTAGMVRAVLSYRAAARGEHGNLVAALSKASTPRVIEEGLAVMPGIEEISLFAVRFARQVGLSSPSAVGGALYQCYLMDPDKLDSFVKGVLEGEGLEVGDARLTLRNRPAQAQWKASGGAQAQAYSFLMVLGAFRAYAQGKRWLKAQVPQNLILIGPTGKG